MKKFKILALFLFGIASMQPIQTSEPLHSNPNQTLVACIYSYLCQQKQTVEEIPVSTQNKSIIFDLDGLLVTTDTMKAFQEIGITTTLQYILTQWKLPSALDVFNVLESTPADSKFEAYNLGIRMPAIMVDWQCATQSLIAIQLAMNRQIRNSEKSDSEKNLLLNTVSMMTTPEKFIATRKTIPTGVDLLHELKDKGYKVYVLSNWDPTSYPLLVKKFPEIFMHNDKETFDGVIISGNVGMLKPNSRLFEKCLIDFDIKASDAIFIDDTIENVQAARELGITSIHCNPHNIFAARQELIKVINS